jgi:uncharacterized protein (TIGR02145 family)
MNTHSGTYKTTIVYTAIGEEIPDPPTPTPPPNIATKTTMIVPNFASTVAPSGNGTGTNGPQFSFYGSGFGANPVVTIDGKACTDVVVNSAGTAMTCTGPVADMTDGEKRTFINGTDAGNNYTIFYSSYTFPMLQSLTVATCQDLPLRLSGSDSNVTVFRDARDSQLYYVARLADNKCWMLDNLKYKPNGDSTGTVTPNFSATQVANTGSTNMLTIDGTDATGDNWDNWNATKYIDPIVATYCYNNVNKPANNITKCGLLYNFFTSTAGTATSGNATGSICPANWRVPIGYINSDFKTGDFAILNGSMNAGTLAAGSISSGTGYYENWQHSGVFAGIRASGYNSTFASTGFAASYWSSTVGSARFGSVLSFDSTSVSTTGYQDRLYGDAIRCVIGS